MKRYDRAYFDRWYRGPDAPAGKLDALERHVALAVAVTESVLDRALASVLDVGCGVGRWQPVLQRLRPDATYLGIDSSDYAVERFGAERNLQQGSFENLELHDFEDPFDLVVCADVLHYLTDAAIEQGLDTLVDLVGGAALIEVFTAADEAEGDREGFHLRPAEWYRERFRAAGLVPVGLQLYVHHEIAEDLEALDRP
ncbi:MAG: class I SAM-dependent methyltransferase [Gemmatimonadetes bacterium]|nr:class I SAM-dependent methyltransferase [Gemmatimonadota bacterium]